MARIRTIKPEFPQSEGMGRVSRDARLLFVMLWTLCDDVGRTRASPRMLASLLFPYDDDAQSLTDGWLTELEREKCVQRYQIDGNNYIQVLNWTKHQHIDRPSKPKFPAPPNATKPRRKLATPSRATREPSQLDQGSRIKEGIKDQGREDSSSLRSDISAPLKATVVEPKKPEPDLFEIPECLDRRAKAAEIVPIVEGAIVEAGKADRDAIDKAVEAYNRTAKFAGWPACSRLTNTRQRALRMRLEDSGGISGWCAAMARATKSSFLLGRQGRDGDHASWRPNIDFFLRSEKFTKLMEGGYDDTPGKANVGSSALDEGAARAAAAYG